MAKYRKIQISSDSLELLLDTMCNTFGGIMFIAISLLIISSFVSKTTSTNIESENSASLKLKMEQMQQEIKSVQAKNTLKQHLINGLKNNPKGDIVKNISLLQDENINIENDISSLKNEIQAVNKKIDTLEKENRKKKNTILVANLNTVKLQKKLQSLKKEYDLAIESENKREQRKLHFNKLGNTKRTPFWGILSKNRLYKIGRTLMPEETDLRTELVSGGVRYLPIQGRGFFIGKIPNRELKKLG